MASTILPVDQNGRTIPLVPATIPYDTTVNSSISSATSITLQASTTIIEVQATNFDVYLKYAAGVTTASNGFHEHIMADTIRHFVIPPSVTVISVIEGAATAIVHIIEK